MTKMADMHIFGKSTLKIFSPGASGLISTKLGMKHWRLKSIIFCSNVNPVLTLTYFRARSNFCNSGFDMGKYDND